MLLATLLGAAALFVVAQASRNGVDQVDLFTSGSGAGSDDQTIESQTIESQAPTSLDGAEAESSATSSVGSSTTAGADPSPVPVDPSVSTSITAGETTPTTIGEAEPDPSSTASTGATSDTTTADTASSETTSADTASVDPASSGTDAADTATGDTDADTADTVDTASDGTEPGEGDAEPDAASPDGTTTDAEAESESEPAAADPGRTPFELLLLGGLAIAGLGTLAYLLWSLIRSLRTSHDDDDPLDTELPIPALDPLLALDRLRRALETEPDPRQAIRRAYAAVESGFGRPDLARRVGETPYRFFDRTLRVIGSSSADDELVDSLATPLDRLTNLFLLARYSEHEITEAMRTDAIGSVMTIRDRFRAAEAAAAEHAEDDAGHGADDRVPASL